MRGRRYFGAHIGVGALASLDAALSSGAADSLDQGTLQAAAAEAGLGPDELHKLVAGVTSNADLARAIVGYAHIDEHTQAATNLLASGNYGGALKAAAQGLGASPGSAQLIDAGVSLASGDLKDAIAPIVGGAVSLIATPAVGAAVAGVIAIGVKILDALGVLGHDPHCDWMVGPACFSGERPYGPDDPHWTPLGSYIAHVAQGPFPTGKPPTDDDVQHLFSVVLGEPYGAAILRDVRALEGPDPIIPGFWAGLTDSPMGREKKLNGLRLAFGRAYLANIERAINGHPYSDVQTLLNQVMRAWNATHAGATFVLSPDAPGNLPTPIERLWADHRLPPTPIALDPRPGHVIHLRKLSKPRMGGVTLTGKGKGAPTMTANPPTMVYAVQHGQWYQQSDWIPYADAMNLAHTMALQGLATGAYIYDHDTSTMKWVSAPGAK